MNAKETILKYKAENPSHGHRKIAENTGFSQTTVRYYSVPGYREKHIQRARDRGKSELIELKKKLGNCCSICGYSKCLNALHFHHVNPDNKSFCVAVGFRKRGPKIAREEAKKCILICANCHAEIHAEERNLARSRSG